MIGVFELAMKDVLGRDGAMTLAGGALCIEADLDLGYPYPSGCSSMDRRRGRAAR